MTNTETRTIAELDYDLRGAKARRSRAQSLAAAQATDQAIWLLTEKLADAVATNSIR
jgi:hypothetical protein